MTALVTDTGEIVAKIGPLSLEERLAAVQAALKAPKSQFNSHGKYRYRSCEDILEAAKPLLKEAGLLLTLHDELVEISGRFYVRAYAFLECPETNSKMKVSAFAREQEELKGMTAAQITGAASSYARKYALNGLFLIDDTADDDARESNDKPSQKPREAARRQQRQQPKPKPQTPEEAAKARLWRAIKAYCQRHGTNPNAELEELGGKEVMATKDAAWLNAKSEYYEAN